MSAIEEQQAVYVLNRRPYQETSLLIDVFSLNFGRFSLLAKGAMRKSSGWSALLQPFRSLLIAWSGRSSLKTLRSVDVPSHPYGLASNYLFSAYYINELVQKLLPENEANELVFASYVECLTHLSARQDLQRTLRKFEYQLLEELGLLPDFKRDLEGRSIVASKRYRLLLQQGFDLVRSDLIQDMRFFTIKGRVIELLDDGSAFESPCWSGEDYLQAKQLMRCLIDDALGGQFIKSRELFRAVKYKE